MYSAERNFVATAHAQLLVLDDDGQDAHTHFPAAIEQIKQAAAPVKARAIYRAALLCEDVLKRSSSATDVNFRNSVMRLNSLVKSYADGLYEIDPEFKQITLDPSVISETHSAQDLSSGDLQAANENAAKVLQPLLRLVKDDGRTKALKLLANFSTQSETKSRQTSVRFDAVMRQITNRALGEARARAKIVSISYAADFDIIDASIMPGVRTYLQEVCLEIVRDGLVVGGDLAASLHRAWQISITGETQGQNLAFSISWPGQEISEICKIIQLNKEMKDLGGKVNAKTVQGLDGGTDTQLIEYICPARKPEQIPKPTPVPQTQAREG